MAVDRFKITRSSFLLALPICGFRVAGTLSKLVLDTVVGRSKEVFDGNMPKCTMTAYI